MEQRIFAVGDLVWTYGKHRGVVARVLERGRYTIDHEGHAGTSTEEIWDLTPREKDPLVIRALMTDAQRERLADVPATVVMGANVEGFGIAHTLAELGSKDTETPGRFLRAMRELTAGEREDQDASKLLRTFPIEAGSDPGVVCVRSVPFASVCEHHALPFSGTIDVAYIPNDRIVGLSKIPRLVRLVTRRFQVQERIGSMVADALLEHVGAIGVLVRIRARHSCMALRGAESPGEMVTCCVRGVFMHDPSARAEALTLIG